MRTKEECLDAARQIGQCIFEDMTDPDAQGPKWTPHTPIRMAFTCLINFRQEELDLWRDEIQAECAAEIRKLVDLTFGEGWDTI